LFSGEKIVSSEKIKMFDNTPKIEFPGVINGTGCMLNNDDTERRGFFIGITGYFNFRIGAIDKRYPFGHMKQTAPHGRQAICRS
jgi:hypothetical protein